MVKENQKRYLLQAVQAIDRLLLFNSEHSLEEALEDFRISDVYLMEFENLANAVMKLDDELIAMDPKIPLLQLKGIRNRIAHDYLSVSIEILFEAINKDLSNLRIQLSNLLFFIDK